MEPITTSITTGVIRATSTKVVSTISDFFIKEFSKLWQGRKFSSNNEDLIKSIEKIANVKTLFHGADKPVNLYDFFIVPTLTLKNEEPLKITNINQIRTEHNILIEGTVGQGKSMLMRYLALQDLLENHKIPIFIELKNISKEKSLEFLVKENLTLWLNKIDDEQFNHLCRSGKISLFIDAFDELSSDHIKNTFSTIESWSKSFNQLKIIVSSRPETDIKRSNFFNIITLQPYDEKDQIALVKKLLSDVNATFTISKAIQSSTPEVKDVLTTPLMVVLFINRFKLTFSAPQNISDFYKNIFELVAITHDQTKGGFVRETLSKLSVQQLEKLFERFCFDTWLKDKLSFSQVEFNIFVQKSLEKTGIESAYDSFILIDFTKYICLVAQDGTDYTFIHRSIQEFYVANFISKLSYGSAEKVFLKISQNTAKNNTIINFTKYLNKYYYNKFYLLNEFMWFKKKISGEYEPIYVSQLASSILSKKEEPYIHVYFKKISEVEFYNDHLLFSELFLYEIFSSFSNKYNMLVVHEIELTAKELLEFKTAEDFEELKHAWNKICIAYKQCLKEIQLKENEINDDDLDI